MIFLFIGLIIGAVGGIYLGWHERDKIAKHTFARLQDHFLNSYEEMKPKLRRVK
jgi:cell division protein FtsL